jgi:hypothetical protein
MVNDAAASETNEARAVRGGLSEDFGMTMEGESTGTPQLMSREQVWILIINTKSKRTETNVP